MSHVADRLIALLRTLIADGRTDDAVAVYLSAFSYVASLEPASARKEKASRLYDAQVGLDKLIDSREPAS